MMISVVSSEPLKLAVTVFAPAAESLQIQTCADITSVVSAAKVLGLTLLQLLPSESVILVTWVVPVPGVLTIANSTACCATFDGNAHPSDVAAAAWVA